MPTTDPPDALDAAARLERRQHAHRRVIRQRRLVALAALTIAIAIALVTVVVTHGGSGRSAVKPAEAAKVAPAKKPAPPPELPGGGRRLFPHHRIVAFYGNPNAPGLGALGIGTPEQASARLLEQMHEYRRGGRRLLPALELIAVVAARSPQKDGSYTHPLSLVTVNKYLKAARRIHGLLILDIQPGHADFMPLTKHLGRFLRQPDVGLALDPEWATPTAVPGTVIGATDAATVNRISRYLQRIVEKYRLPDKLLLVHQFTESMIRNKSQLRRRRGVPIVLNVDGFGNQPVKIAKYDEFTHPRMRGFRSGFKLFYKEDTPTMTPDQVLELRPRPDVIDYE